jgi:hypothetical protein
VGGGLADDDGTGLPQPCHHGRVLARDVAGEVPRSHRGDQPGGVDDVLDRHRYAVQGAARRLVARIAGGLPGAVGVDRDERVQHRLGGGDRVERRLDEFDRIGGPAPKPVDDIGEGQSGERSGGHRVTLSWVR